MKIKKNLKSKKIFSKKIVIKIQSLEIRKNLQAIQIIQIFLKKKLLLKQKKNLKIEEDLKNSHLISTKKNINLIYFEQIKLKK